MSFENILFLFGKILLLGTINKFVLLLLYMSYKGIYKPSNPKKYKGDQSNIIYRSLWERKFMNYCDLNENILEWASEEFWIPYLDPTTNRVRRYFPDFFIKYDFIFFSTEYLVNAICSTEFCIVFKKSNLKKVAIKNKIIVYL